VLKIRFLGQFNNPIRQPAEPIETTPYGQKYRIRATLRGQNGIELKTLTIWMTNNNGMVKFLISISAEDEWVEFQYRWEG
jgi:hypothetical protein